MKWFKILFFSLVVTKCLAQDKPEVYPSHWWVGMKNSNLQLMLHGNNISGGIKNMDLKKGISIQNGITLKTIHAVENPNYLFVDLVIDKNARPGKYLLPISVHPGSHTTIEFELKPRRKGNGSAYAQGITSKDFIYLLMPDRFSNGDYSNDKVTGMKDQSLNRDSIFLRHGGDLQGVINHLDYLQDLGVTALWMTPVLENDMPRRTEHGYAATNDYKVDPRLGGEDAYRQLSDELHKRGLKLIQDVVYNHVGLQHFTVQDLPMKDWLHQWPSFTKPNYKDQVWFDPYVAAIDKKQMADGWFTEEMPDLNQSNPYVANYLIQHAVWSVEEFGVDGWRIDTYIYVDQDFMNRCNKALLDEYPSITMFGESWVTGTANEAFFTQNKINTAFKSNSVGVTDFQCLFQGIQPALNRPDEGVNSLYQTLSNDFLYKNPMNNVIFLDNHDMSRFYSQVEEDIDKLKSGIAWLLTERGIPQLYYGTEVGMKGISNPDGWVRLDFPGGWNGDKKSAFTKEGLTAQESDLLNHTKVLANFRKNSSAIKTGKLIQFVPQDGVYTYFRYDNQQTVMIVMNTSNGEKTIDLTRFFERTKGFTSGRNVITNATNNLTGQWTIPAKTTWVLELVR